MVVELGYALVNGIVGGPYHAFPRPCPVVIRSILLMDMRLGAGFECVGLVLVKGLVQLFAQLVGLDTLVGVELLVVSAHHSFELFYLLGTSS